MAAHSSALMRKCAHVCVRDTVHARTHARGLGSIHSRAPTVLSDARLWIAYTDVIDFAQQEEQTTRQRPRHCK